MTNPPSAPMTNADYEMILGAVLETARGRWFLAEHMRRNRQADTRLVLKAIGQLQRSLQERASVSGAERMRLDLVDMANAIARTKSEIAAIKPADDREGKIGFASNELDAIVETTEKATSEILAAIERIQEIAWRLREQGTDPAVCDVLDKQTTEAYTACSFQDLTGQRIRRIINVMRFLEARIDAMIDILRISERDAPEAEGEDPLHSGPAEPGKGLGQSEIDDLIAVDRSDDVGWREAAPAAKGEIAREVAADLQSDEAGIVPAAAPAPSVTTRDAAAVPVPPPAPSRLSARLREAIEALSPAERMALFS
jgi:chemotaxis regulatin CheY-phosphate phosphatase CheZ